MIFSIDAGKAFDKIERPFLIKILIKSGIERNVFDMIKGTYNDVPEMRNEARVSILIMSIQCCA